MALDARVRCTCASSRGWQRSRCPHPEGILLALRVCSTYGQQLTVRLLLENPGIFRALWEALVGRANGGETPAARVPACLAELDDLLILDLGEASYLVEESTGQPIAAAPSLADSVAKTFTWDPRSHQVPNAITSGFDLPQGSVQFDPATGNIQSRQPDRETLRLVVPGLHRVVAFERGVGEVLMMTEQGLTLGRAKDKSHPLWEPVARSAGAGAPMEPLEVADLKPELFDVVFRSSSFHYFLVAKVPKGGLPMGPTNVNPIRTILVDTATDEQAITELQIQGGPYGITDELSARGDLVVQRLPRAGQDQRFVTDNFWALLRAAAEVGGPVEWY